MPDYEALLSDASRLPLGERMRLIEALWDTVADEPLPPLDEEWMAEINRRSAQYDAGAAEPIPWETIRADALRRAGLKDADDSR
jgi:putative addiction module component (TIGR02574 family)